MNDSHMPGVVTLDLHDEEPQVLLTALNRLDDVLAAQSITYESCGLRNMAAFAANERGEIARIAERLRTLM